MQVHLNPHLIKHSDYLIQWNTAYNGKRIFLLNGVIWAALALLADGIVAYSGLSISRIFAVYTSLSLLLLLLHGVALGSFALWVLSKPSETYFDRQSREIIRRTGTQEIRFPWSTIRFESKWMPTRWYGFHFLTMRAVPPFPDQIRENYAKVLSSERGRDFSITLGGVDCRNGDEVRAYTDFFRRFMESDEAPDILYQRSFRPFA